MWKVAVAVRSPKDPVLRFLLGPRTRPRVRELVIAALLMPRLRPCAPTCSPRKHSRAMPEEQHRGTARELARRFARHPVWLTLAVYVLESQGDLSKVPATAEALADLYLEEIVRNQQQSPAEQVLALLRWVALLGTVNRADDASMKLIGEGSAVGDATQVRGKTRWSGGATSSRGERCEEPARRAEARRTARPRPDEMAFGQRRLRR